MSERGRFIAVEGIDGSGKSTQAKRLQEMMVAGGADVVLTREHTLTGAAGETIERVVTKKQVIHPRALQYMFVADRIDHSEGFIKQALTSGRSVVSDRYYWSTVAYGAAVWDKRKLLDLNLEAGLEEPELWVLVDIDPRVAMVRMAKGRSDSTIFEKEDKLAAARKIYLELAKEFEERTFVVDGDCKEERISNLIYEEVARRGLVS
ncbi:MAG: dTMP kinase [Patescibacteria group bacterium]|jgi:dTMP kinase